MEDYDVARIAMGARSVRGHERVYGDGYTGTAEENYSYWIVHYHDRGAAEGAGARAEPAQPDDLRLEKLSLLLPVDAGWAHVVRRAGGVLSGERSDGAAERRDFAAGHGERVSATGRRADRVRVGRHARLCVRHHAARRTDRRDVLRSRICGTRRRHGDVPGAEDGGVDGGR